MSIAGATGDVYRLRAADVGHEVTVLVTATDTQGESGSAAATPVGPVAPPPPPAGTAGLPGGSRPAFTGTADDGQVLLETSRGTWSSPDTLTYSYQWERCAGDAGWISIAGATRDYYRLTAADVGDAVRLVVTATDQEGQTGQAAASPAGPVGNPPPPTSTGAPAVISGTDQVGAVLTKTSNGTWTSPDPLTFTDRWQRCSTSGEDCVAITGATGDVYRLQAADAGHDVTVVVTATDRKGQTGQAAAVAVGPVSG